MALNKSRLKKDILGEMQKGGMLTEKDRNDQHHPWVKFVNILVNRIVDHLAAESQVYEDEKTGDLRVK